MIRWRELLTSVGVAWVDRGHGLTRDHIGIRCPWCPNETYLALDERTGYYNCWRCDHGGRRPYYLLRALHVRGDLNELLETYGGAPAPVEKPKPPVGSYAKRWDGFTAAADNREACNYLRDRGFWRPQYTAREFDLRVGQGRYSGRLWFPYRVGDQVQGYTGRAMRGQQPRYFTEASSTYLYLPRAPFDSDNVLLLVEGPIDALKLADVIDDRYSVVTAALCGLSITADKRLQLVSLARLIPYLMVVLDSTVQPAAVNRLRQELIPCLSGKAGPSGYADDRVRRLDLPPGVDDPGEMTKGDIDLWLQQTGIAALAHN